MKKVLKLQKLKFMLCSVLGFMLCAFTFAGVNSFKKVSADESEIPDAWTPVITSRELPQDVEITWSEVKVGDTFGGKYYAFLASDGTCAVEYAGIGLSDNALKNDSRGESKVSIGNYAGVSSIESTAVSGNDVYNIVYMPESMSENFTFFLGYEEYVSLNWNEDTTVTKVSGTVYSFDIRSTYLHPGDIVFNTPEFPADVEITWSEVNNGDKVGGKYYAFPQESSEIELIFGDNLSLHNYSWGKAVFSIDSVWGFSYFETSIDNDAYYVIYIPEEVNINRVFETGNGVEVYNLAWDKEATINTKYCDSGFTIYSFDLGSVSDEPIEPEIPNDVTILEMYAEVFNVPNRNSKTNWKKTNITIDESNKATYAGRWFRWEKPTSTLDNKAIDIQFTTNGVIKSESVVFDLETEKIILGRFSIEYNSVVYDGKIYLEFYLPKTFELKSCVAGSLDNIYEDYFDKTYVITNKNDNANIVFISAPTNTGGSSSNNGSSNATEAEEYSGVEKIGAVVCEILNIEDKSCLAVGWTTIVLSVTILGFALLIIFKR